MILLLAYTSKNKNNFYLYIYYTEYRIHGFYILIYQLFKNILTTVSKYYIPTSIIFEVESFMKFQFRL